MTKYTCRKNLEIMEHSIQSIRNRNKKMDYEKIYKDLKNNLNNVFLYDKEITNLYILNYIIEKHIYEINKIY